MSHADTLRWEDSGGGYVVAASDFDALVMENQRLREALEHIAHGFSGGWRTTVARKALDRTPSAAQTLEDATPDKESRSSSVG